MVERIDKRLGEEVFVCILLLFYLFEYSKTFLSRPTTTEPRQGEDYRSFAIAGNPKMSFCGWRYKGAMASLRIAGLKSNGLLSILISANCINIKQEHLIKEREIVCF